MEVQPHRPLIIKVQEPGKKCTCFKYGHTIWMIHRCVGASCPVKVSFSGELCKFITESSSPVNWVSCSFTRAFVILPISSNLKEAFGQGDGVIEEGLLDSLFFLQLDSLFFQNASLLMTVIISIQVLKAFLACVVHFISQPGVSSLAPLGGVTSKATADQSPAALQRVREHKSLVPLCETEKPAWLGARRRDLIVSAVTLCCVEIYFQNVSTLWASVHLCMCVCMCVW